MDTVLQKNNSVSGRIAVWVLTSHGKQLGETLCRHLKQARLFISSRLANVTSSAAASGAGRPDPESQIDCTPDHPKTDIRVFHRLSGTVREQFHKFDCHVFVFSTGIAVRIIAPLLGSKLTDPAVVVVDDMGGHAVSLISGHIGHANQYTRKIAHLLGATPVITTATDVNQLPAIDLVADRQNLFIETPGTIKTINMAFLENKKIGLHDPLNLVRPLIPDQWADDTPSGCPRVFCDWRITPVSRETLVLRPRVLAVGIGCNRHTPLDTIADFYTTVLTTAGISRHSVYLLATTDIKKDEPGILALAKALDLPIRFYDNARLSSVKTIQNPSKMVKKHIGVHSVCEAAAILAAHNGPLILPKQKNLDVTLAVALKKTGSMS
ncbi:MAG: cobalt-precorrin 5A hydrolase [Desulfotignum sp.]|nr:cobalt-precorrin 5A hydrolase [Desulfotignum sp.]